MGPGVCQVTTPISLWFVREVSCAHLHTLPGSLGGAVCPMWAGQAHRPCTHACAWVTCYAYVCEIFTLFPALQCAEPLLCTPTICAMLLVPALTVALSQFMMEPLHDITWWS